MPKLPEVVAKAFKVVKYNHRRFMWKGKNYDLSSLTLAQAKELYATNWPYLVKAKKPKPKESV